MRIRWGRYSGSHMSENPQERLGALFPHLSGEELPAAHERLRAYVALAAEIAAAGEPPLTPGSGLGTVEAGPVEPRTFTNTG